MGSECCDENFKIDCTTQLNSERIEFPAGIELCEGMSEYKGFGFRGENVCVHKQNGPCEFKCQILHQTLR